MAYQTTTTTSYGQRVGNSFKGILTGIVLFIGGTVLLWWNEGRAVKTDKMLNEAEEVTVEMSDISKVDATFDGKLVWATGMTATSDSLADTKFPVGSVAVQLERKVEYYQWEEHEKEETKDKLGGGQETVTTYTYEKAWVSKPINSSNFADPQYQSSNFTLAQFDDEVHYAQNVSFGAYRLNESQIHSFSGSEGINLDLDDETLRGWNDEVARVLNKPVAQVTTTTDSLGSKYEFVHQQDNVLYFGKTPNNPQIGDVRITFTKIMPKKISILAAVKGDTFAQYKTDHGMFSTIRMGEYTAAEMYQQEHDNNTMLTWILRLVGVLCVVGGLKGIFGILETLAKVVPFIANIVGFGVGLICTIVGVVWSLIVIALAWIFYRPLLGIAILVIAGGIIWYFSTKGKKKNAEAAAATAAAATAAPAPAQPTETPSV
ncbi:MAG: TMEM43 family protein [Bacteroidaceae bacterium]|nr:TMEM43 family protein [Bacteroidaceae bacterium]